MELEKTGIWSDVLKITKSGVKSGNQSARFDWSIVLHTTDLDFSVYKILNIDINSDFVNNISDEITVSFTLDNSTYVSKFYPYIKNMEATLTMIAVGEFNQGQLTSAPYKVAQRFKVVFLPADNAKPVGGLAEMADAGSVSLTGFTLVHLQLINRSVEPLRIKTTSGISRGYTNEDNLRAILSSESKKILVDGKPVVSFIDIVKADNIAPNKHLVLPSGTKVITVPTFIHEMMGGLYNAGIGSYLKSYNGNNTWFIYPTHAINKPSASKPKAVLIALPENKLSFNDRTYRVESDVTYIIGHLNNSFIDDGETQFMESGVGFRMADSSAYMKKPVIMTPDGPKASRQRLNYEVSTTTRDDNLNYAPGSNKGSSSNPFTEYSNVNKRNGNKFMFIWQSGNNNLIYPGMSIVFKRMSGTNLIELNGIILKITTVIQADGRGTGRTTFTSRCVLTIFVEKKG
jgi:hypothetical protein